MAISLTLTNDSMIIILVVVAVLVITVWSRRSGLLSGAEEEYFAEIVSEVNDRKPRRRHLGPVATIVQEAKIEFGPMRRTEANRMIVHRFIRDKMREIPDMRPGNILKLLPVAVETVFLASDAEIVALQARGSRAFQAQHDKSTIRWWSWLTRQSHDLGFSA